MRVLVAGYYGFDNLGDELILAALTERLKERYGNPHITVLSAAPAQSGMSTTEILFSETNSRFIATVCPTRKDEFEAVLEGAVFAHIGSVTLDPVLRVKSGDDVCAMDVDDLTEAYTSTLDGV